MGSLHKKKMTPLGYIEIIYLVSGAVYDVTSESLGVNVQARCYRIAHVDSGL